MNDQESNGRRSGKTRRRLLRIAIASAVLSIVGTGSGLAYLRWDIQSSLNDLCETAQQTHPHPGDHVAALVAYMSSDSHTFRQRNLAVWTLGQLRDERALPALQAVYTGEDCSHDEYLCQRELLKAIKLCRGETPNLLGIKAP